MSKIELLEFMAIVIYIVVLLRLWISQSYSSDFTLKEILFDKLGIENKKYYDSKQKGDSAK